MIKVNPSKFNGIFLIGSKIATINLIPGYRSANEELIKVSNTEYRIWDPYSSKPSAAIKKGIKTFPIEQNQKILYLGIASGKTSSFFSDIIGKEGIIYGVEFSERVFRSLIDLSKKRGNIVPILADARKPEDYYWVEEVDVIYCDIAQPDESLIAIRNADEFLKPSGYLLIAVKSQSIDVTKDPKQIYEEEKNKLKKSGFNILQSVDLEPYEKKHAMILVRK